MKRLLFFTTKTCSGAGKHLYRIEIRSEIIESGDSTLLFNSTLTSYTELDSEVGIRWAISFLKYWLWIQKEKDYESVLISLPECMEKEFPIKEIMF